MCFLAPALNPLATRVLSATFDVLLRRGEPTSTGVIVGLNGGEWGGVGGSAMFDGRETWSSANSGGEGGSAGVLERGVLHPPSPSSSSSSATLSAGVCARLLPTSSRIFLPRLLNLLAPGRLINSSVLGGNFRQFTGTSMAAPHVAGAWALLNQAAPNASVPQVLNALSATGRPITDPRNAKATPSIAVPAVITAALDRVCAGQPDGAA